MFSTVSPICINWSSVRLYFFVSLTIRTHYCLFRRWWESKNKVHGTIPIKYRINKFSVSINLSPHGIGCETHELPKNKNCVSLIQMFVTEIFTVIITYYRTIILIKLNVPTAHTYTDHSRFFDALLYRMWKNVLQKMLKPKTTMD